MSFNARKDMDKLNLILEWDGVRKANFAVDGAEEWTDEELRGKADLSDDEIARFRKNLIDCQKDAKERKADEVDAALLEASSRVSVFKDAIFVYNPLTGVYDTGNKAKQRLMYEALGSAKADRWDFIEFDPRSQMTIVDSLNTDFIRVGSRFFDVVNGTMVDDAPEEFRTFAIKQDVNYTPVKFDECTSKLISDMKEYLGADNLKYVLLNVAYNLTGLRVNKRSLVIGGETRSGKGTFNKSMKMIGLAPDKNLRGDFEAGNRFCDQLGCVIGLYPVVCADDCKTLDWELLKAIASDDTMSVEPKGEKKFTAATRAMPIVTLNSAVRSVSDGIVNKICILQTAKSFRDEIDPDYFEKIEADGGFEELINLILTMTHQMTIHAWDPSIMPESVVKHNDNMLKEFLYHDLFISKWDRDPSVWTSTKEAYIAYLHYANPDVDYGLIKMKVDELKNKTQQQPEGLAGRSWQNFTSSLKLSGIKEKKSRVIDSNGKEVSVRGFVGKPFFETDIGENTDISSFC